VDQFKERANFMRVQLWCDMEGIAGISRWEQVTFGNPLFEEGRRLYTGEVNAAVQGAKRAGAREIIVIDGHGAGGASSMNSLLKEELEPGAEYIFGYRWGCYVEALEAGCDALLLPGAHARAGSVLGCMSHTMSETNWILASINGIPVGESGIIAGIAGHFGTPVVFVSGDDETCREVRELVGAGVVQAPVKRALGRFTARHLAPRDARALIEQRAYEALTQPSKWPRPWNPGSPVEFRVDVHHPNELTQYHHRHGVEVVGDRTVVSRGPSVWHVWDQLWVR
jgi:D-amino peptidase